MPEELAYGPKCNSAKTLHSNLFTSSDEISIFPKHFFNSAYFYLSLIDMHSFEFP